MRDIDYDVRPENTESHAYAGDLNFCLRVACDEALLMYSFWASFYKVISASTSTTQHAFPGFAVDWILSGLCLRTFWGDFWCKVHIFCVMLMIVMVIFRDICVLGLSTESIGMSALRPSFPE